MLALAATLALLGSTPETGRLVAPVGLVRSDDQFSELMPAGTRLPATAREVFVAVDAKQRNFQLSLVQQTKFGLEPVTDVILQDLPRRASKRIVVSFFIDAQRMIWVTASVKGVKSRKYGPFQLN